MTDLFDMLLITIKSVIKIFHKRDITG